MFTYTYSCADGDGLLLQYKGMQCIESRGRVVVTLPVLLYNEYHHFKCFKKSESDSKNSRRTSKKKQFKLTALRDLRKLTVDRYVCAGLANKLCGVMEKLLLILVIANRSM